MVRLTAPFLTLALAAAAAAMLSACGGGEDAKLLPGRTAEEINENLDSVQRLAAEGECVGARDAALQVSAQVESVSGVDPKLESALEQGAARLQEVVDTCEETEETTETTEPEPTPTPERAKEAEKALEKEEEKLEKEEEKEAKETEKAEQEEEAEEEPPPGLPPQANGEAKGHTEAPPAETGPPSGGIGPGSEVGAED